MITHENIEIIHYFLQVDKALFKVMLAQLLAEYKAIHTLVRIVIFDAPADNEEYVARFACIREAVKELFKEKQPSVSYVAQPPQRMGLVILNIGYWKICLISLSKEKVVNACS